MYYGILKRIFNASYLSFYIPGHGDVDCRLYGVNTADNLGKSMCVIAPEEKRKMSFYTTLEARNMLSLEQQYKIRFINNLCVVYYGAKTYNKELAKNGYGLNSPYGVSQKDDGGLFLDIQRLEESAREKKLGLWQEWTSEFGCLAKEEKMSAGTKK